MQTPKEVMLAWIEAFNRRDPHAAAALYDDDAQSLQVAVGDLLVGKKAIENNLTEFFQHVPDNTTQLENILVDGDRVSIEWIGRGNFFGSPGALGRSFEFRGCGFFRVRNGKIVFQRGYWDKADWFKQIGVPLE